MIHFFLLQLRINERNYVNHALYFATKNAINDEPDFGYSNCLIYFTTLSIKKYL
jgi:hypothetical protein